MKAVAINGSPRKGGNTEILLKKALAPLAAAGWEPSSSNSAEQPSADARLLSVFQEENSGAARRMMFSTGASRKWSRPTRSSSDHRRTSPT